MAVKERNPEESSNRIIMAAERIFAAKGLDGARVDEIASAAKVNKRMIYHYFGSKEELYTEVLRKNYQKVVDMGNQTLYTNGDILQRVKDFISLYFNFLAKNEIFVRLIHWESLHGGRFSRKILPDIAAATMPQLKTLLEQGVRQGVFRQDLDIRHLIISINAICLMYFFRQDFFQFLWSRNNIDEELLQERLDHVLDFTLNGILHHH